MCEAHIYLFIRLTARRKEDQMVSKHTEKAAKLTLTSFKNNSKNEPGNIFYRI